MPKPRRNLSTTTPLTVAQAKQRHANIANAYFSQAPTLSNIYNGSVNWLRSKGILEPEGTGLITGVAPTPAKMSGSIRDWERWGSDIARKNGLEIFSATNGKTYVRLNDGTVKSLQSFGRDAQSEAEAATLNYIKAAGRRPTTPYKAAPLRDPAIHLSGTRGSINSVKKGRVSNRGAKTANDL